MEDVHIQLNWIVEVFHDEVIISLRTKFLQLAWGWFRVNKLQAVANLWHLILLYNPLDEVCESADIFVDAQSFEFNLSYGYFKSRWLVIQSPKFWFDHLAKLEKEKDQSA